MTIVLTERKSLRKAGLLMTGSVCMLNAPGAIKKKEFKE